MNEAVMLLAGLAVGLAIGTIGAMGRRRELRRRLEQQDAELAASREREREQASETAKAQSDANAKAMLLQERDQFYARQLADLREAFKALSSDALRENAPRFIQLATETFKQLQEGAKGDLAQRQEAISGLVAPLKEQLEAYRQQLQASEQNHAQARAVLQKEIETLSANNKTLADETARFRMVMKSPPARGRWGEVTLRNVIEAAQMSAHCDFREQCTGDDKRPDLMIRLPGDKHIIVDAKTPELDDLAELDADNRAAALADYAKKLRTTITELSRRNYAEQFPGSLDHVVLFLPAESLFSAALEGDPDLLFTASRQRVMVATPATLLAMLNAVRVSWGGYAQSEHAREIAEAAQELYKRVVVLVEHFSSIGKSIGAAAEAYNRAVASYDTRVRVTGEQLAKLGLPTNQKTLDAIPAVEATLREIL